MSLFSGEYKNIKQNKQYLKDIRIRESIQNSIVEDHHMLNFINYNLIIYSSKDALNNENDDSNVKKDIIKEELNNSDNENSNLNHDDYKNNKEDDLNDEQVNTKDNKDGFGGDKNDEIINAKETN